jgi:hypothetical protein
MKLKNNKQRGQLCNLASRREKRKKKQKQSITGGNPTTISQRAPHRVDDTATCRGRWRLTKFSRQVVSDTPPTR